MFSRFKLMFIPVVYYALNTLNYQLAPYFHQKGAIVNPALLWIISASVTFLGVWLIRKIVFPIFKKLIWFNLAIFASLQVIKSMNYPVHNWVLISVVCAWFAIFVAHAFLTNKILRYFVNKWKNSVIWARIRRFFKIKTSRNCNINLTIQQIDRFGNGNKNAKGRMFEEYVAELYRTLGYNAETTTSLRHRGMLPESIQKRGGSGEQGVDVLVEIFNNGQKHLMAIQCKHYSDKVDNSAVQQIAAALPLYGASKGVVVTNQFFTKPAKELAIANGVTLIDRDKLQTLIESATKEFNRREKAA